MGLVIGTALGFIFGILASWSFWRIQLRIKPNLELSPKIVVFPANKEEPKKKYTFKLLNLGNRQIIEIQTRIAIVEKEEKYGGVKNVEKYLFPLKFDSIMVLCGQKEEQTPWNISPFGSFVSYPDHDINSMLKSGDRRILFTVSAKDALSGTVIVTRREYTFEDIVCGEFVPGNTLKIIEGECT